MVHQNDNEASRRQVEMQVAKKTLNSMAVSELQNFYYSLNLGPAIAETAPKDFVIAKIIDKVNTSTLLRNEKIA